MDGQDISNVFRVLNDIHKDLADVKNRLDVHNQAHHQIDDDMRRMGDALREHNTLLYGTPERPGFIPRLIVLEQRTGTISDTLQEIKSQNSKIIWAILTPVIALVVAGIFWAIAQQGTIGSIP